MRCRASGQNGSRGDGNLPAAGNQSRAGRHRRSAAATAGGRSVTRRGGSVTVWFGRPPEARSQARNQKAAVSQRTLQRKTNIMKVLDIALRRNSRNRAVMAERPILDYDGMKLKDLLVGAGALELPAGRDDEISSVAYDSRRVSPGSLFVAIEGEINNGNRFISTPFPAVRPRSWANCRLLQARHGTRCFHRLAWQIHRQFLTVWCGLA